ncbi:MAG: class I SAM-dependent methyltransferase [Rhodospirillales bacterium]|nr:class I SAM-dependent methyltransferase [Rhodospirillales bacterium]
MTPILASSLCCPNSREPMMLTGFEFMEDRVKTGILVAENSLYWYPVIDGIPRFCESTKHPRQLFLEIWKQDPKFPENIVYPPVAQDNSPELSHYEINGIELSESDSFEEARRALSLSLIPDDTGAVLEVGAGPGAFLSLLEAERPEINVFGIERSSSAIEAARCVALILQGEAEQLPVANRSVDCVVSMKTLEHLSCGIYERAIQEMIRVANRYILINVPDRERRLQSVCPSCACVFNPSYHMRSFDQRSLDDLFPGFSISKRVEQPRRVSLLAALALPFRKRIFDGFVAYGICPQCGYRKSNSSALPHNLSQKSMVRSTIRSLAGLLPKVDVRGDVMVLYERQV